MEVDNQPNIQYSQLFNGVTVTVTDFVRLISDEFFDQSLKFLAFSCSALNYLQENTKNFKDRSKNLVNIKRTKIVTVTRR